MSGPLIRSMTPEDWGDVRRIYEDGIESGHATFEVAPPEWPEWDRAHLARPRLVAEVADRVEGWAALSPVSRRPVYAGVAEVSVYVGATSRGRGLGGTLLRRLIEESEAAGLWTLQASIFPENGASMRLHERSGFRVVGRRERIGRQHGVWRDVILFERRSGVAG
jgi:L-amino acid N-acyltransferase YncA